MASSAMEMCGNCHFVSGDGEIIICTHNTHYGLAMRREAVCDFYVSPKSAVPGTRRTIVIGETVGGEDR